MPNYLLGVFWLLAMLGVMAIGVVLHIPPLGLIWLFAVLVALTRLVQLWRRQRRG